MSKFSIKLGDLIKDPGFQPLADEKKSSELLEWEANQSEIDKALYQLAERYWQTPITITLAESAVEMVLDDLMFVWQDLGTFLSETASMTPGASIYLGEWLASTPVLMVTEVNKKLQTLTVMLDIPDSETEAEPTVIDLPAEEFLAQWIFFLLSLYNAVTEQGYFPKNAQLTGTFKMLKRIMN